MKKKLYKSVKDRKLTGVCGGIEEYFDIDSSIVNSMACFDLLYRNGSAGLYYLCDSSILMNKIFLKLLNSLNKNYVENENEKSIFLVILLVVFNIF